MNLWKFPGAIYVLLLLSTACTKEAPPLTSFYYWKTTFELNDTEVATLKQNSVSKLYVRYFDVTLIKGAPFPVRPIVFNEPPPAIEIVPVIYVRNQVMLSPTVGVPDLAKNIVDYIDQINAKNNVSIEEIQIDCDWTLKSKDVFLRFIDALKQQTKHRLSATIRLHQVKYFETTGVPDVDYGVLMYYNMGHINADDSSNSIYDRKTAKRYLASLKNYPLRLDVALPLFSWGIHSRDGKVIGLLNQWSHESIDSTKFNNQGGDLYVAKDNFITLGNFFRKGDFVKIEAIDKDQISEMADDIARSIAKKPQTVIFYDLDEPQLTYHDDEDLFEEITRTF
ncbi:hypothetical protein [Pseudochryseolinea flava]|uniref:Lipoprotein n=1 Tax=Pseudochryseolinea flava TaxID=2059302 RepID=A0A364XYJ4_9BACT|nr:hypothetical protein [Pseudochryseolinea flava]RAV98496.1 hypothetical protein DQQ10_23525 [Pseudochryseolinea flava]